MKQFEMEAIMQSQYNNTKIPHSTVSGLSRFSLGCHTHWHPTGSL